MTEIKKFTEEDDHWGVVAVLVGEHVGYISLAGNGVGLCVLGPADAERVGKALIEASKWMREGEKCPRG